MMSQYKQNNKFIAAVPCVCMRHIGADNCPLETKGMKIEASSSWLTVVSVTQTQNEATKMAAPKWVWGKAIEKSPSLGAILVTQTPLR